MPGTSAPLSYRDRIIGFAVRLADCPAEDDREFERIFDGLEHAIRAWAFHLHQRRAAKARWTGTTVKERREFMRRAGRASGEARRASRASSRPQRRAQGGAL